MKVKENAGRQTEVSGRNTKLLCSCRIFKSDYEGKPISKLQIVIEKRRMGIMTYKPHLFFDVISKQI